MGHDPRRWVTNPFGFVTRLGRNNEYFQWIFFKKVQLIIDWNLAHEDSASPFFSTDFALPGGNGLNGVATHILRVDYRSTIDALSNGSRRDTRAQIGDAEKNGSDARNRTENHLALGGKKMKIAGWGSGRCRWKGNDTDTDTHKKKLRARHPHGFAVGSAGLDQPENGLAISFFLVFFWFSGCVSRSRRC